MKKILHSAGTGVKGRGVLNTAASSLAPSKYGVIYFKYEHMYCKCFRSVGPHGRKE